LELFFGGAKPTKAPSWPWDCVAKEQKARLQCLASAMPKSVIPPGAKNGKVSKEI